MRAKFFNLGKSITALCAAMTIQACNSPSQTELSELIGASSTSTSTSSGNTGTTLTIVGGNFQIAAPSSSYANPLVVQLLDNGSPLSGKTINFTVTSIATGTLSAAAVVTDGSGMAQITVTAGATSGTLGIQATYNSFSANFTESIVDQSGSSIAIFSGNSQSAAVNTNLTNQLKVLVTNTITSLPAPNIVVTFLVTGGNGQINGVTNSLNVTTDALGIAAINFKTGTLAGANTIKALIAANTGQFVNFTATGTTSLASFDLTQSTLTANVGSMVANGTDIANLTFTLKDAYGNTLSPPTGTVVFSTTAGNLLGTTNNNNGTYSDTLLAPTTGGGTTVTISATYNGNPCTNTALITLVSGSYSIANSTLTTSTSNVVADGVSYTTVKVKTYDSFGNPLTTGGLSVNITSTGSGVMLGSGVTDLGNGEYTRLFKSLTTTGTGTVSATINAVAMASSVNVNFIAGAANAGTSTLAVSPSVVVPDNSSTSTIVLTTKDVYGNVRSATSSGTPTVSFTTTLGTLIGAAVNNGNGTYQQTIKSNASGTATVQAIINGVTTTASKLIYFNAAGSTPNLNNSLVEVIGSSTLPADGSTTATVKVTLKDNSNIPFTSGGNIVQFSTTGGTLIGSVSDNGNGTYTQLIQAPSSSVANVTVSATVDGSNIVDTASMNFYGAISLATSTLSSTAPSIEATGTSTTTIVLTAKDSSGNIIPVGGETGIVIATTAGTMLGSLLDNNNGTYTQVLQSTAVGNTATVSATKSAVPFSATTSVVFFVANNWSGLTMDCTADDLTGNFTTAATSIAKRIRLWGNNVIVDGGTLIINTRSAAGYCPNTFTFSNFIVRNNATVTHTAIGTGTTIYNTEFTTATLSVDNTSKIDASSKGLQTITVSTCRVPAGTTVSPSAQNTTVGWQTGFSQCAYGGGAHGGEGTTYYSYVYSGNSTYGNLFQPTDPGASGSYQTGAGVGGGIVKINVTGTATIDGSVRADGGGVSALSWHSGAGGSVWLNVGTLTGIGYISANGGSSTAGGYTGGGGGGRIAVYYTNPLAGSFSMPSSLFTGIRAYGGLGYSNGVQYYAAAGTIYLKAASQTYGDLVINNNGNLSGDFVYHNTYANIPKTTIKTPAIQVPTSVTGTTLTKAGQFADNYKTDSPYVGWFINPNNAQNATTTRMDDALFKITSADADSVTISSGSMTSAPVNATTSTNFQLMLIFDRVEIRGKANVNAPFFLALSGDISSNYTNTVTLNSGLINTAYGFEYDNASITWNANSAYSSITVPYNLDLTPIRYSNRNFSLTNSRFTFATGIVANDFSLSGTTGTGSVLRGSPSLTLNGSLALTNSSNLTHAAASTTVTGAEYSLEVTATGLTIDGTSALHADGAGYLSNTSGKCRTAGNKEVNGYNGAITYITGGSHGGYGTIHSGIGVPNQPYGSVTNPYTAGASCYYNTGGFGSPTRGGGIVRVNLGTGNAVIDGRISSNGVGGSTYTEAGAGGSILLDAGAVSGTGYIAANGGSITALWGGGGSGGRIAVNYTSLAGNFAYPTNLISNIRAYGGYGGQSGVAHYAGAGTVFVKNKSQTLGDLIVNNNGNVSCNSYLAAYRCGTAIISPVRSAISSLTTNTSTYSTASIFQEESENTNAVIGYAVVPNIAENGSSYLSTKTRFPINSLANNVIGTSGTGMTSVAIAGNTSAFPFVVRNLQISGKGSLYTSENIIVTEGDIASNDTTSMVMDGGFSGPGIAELTDSANVTITNGITSHAGYFSGPTGIASLTVGSGGRVYLPSTANISGNLTMTDGAISGNSLTVGGNLNLSGSSTLLMSTTGYSPNLIVTGNIDLSGTSTITPGAASATTQNRLYITANNITIGATASINAEGRGSSTPGSGFYLYGANQTIGRSGVSCNYGGGSHGGIGGINTNSSAEPYDNFKMPVEVGLSGCFGSYSATNGGGAIRLSVANILEVNGTVNANGQTQTVAANHQTTGAGGSVLIQTTTLQGTGSITANGGVQTWAGNNVGAGGGGRIAVYYTSSVGNFSYPASMLTNVTAFGAAAATGLTTGHGGAGTIYLKSATQTYGDLIINNNNVLPGASSPTLFRAPIASVNTSITNGNLTLNKASQFGYFLNAFNQYSLTNRLLGYFINPNTSQNATTQLNDDITYEISSSDNNSITTTSDMTVGTSAANGTGYRTLLILDNLEVRGKAVLDATNMGIWVRNGDLSSNNTTSFVLDGTITSTTLDLWDPVGGVGATWTNTANGAYTITNRCNLGAGSTPTTACP